MASLLKSHNNVMAFSVDVLAAAADTCFVHSRVASMPRSQILLWNGEDPRSALGHALSIVHIDDHWEVWIPSSHQRETFQAICRENKMDSPLNPAANDPVQVKKEDVLNVIKFAHEVISKDN